MSSKNGVQIESQRVGVACDLAMRDVPDAERCYDDPSAVDALVIEAMRQAGLGQTDPARPLADVIRPGLTVLLKPNWVMHRNQAPFGSAPLVTHSAFILSALRHVLATAPGQVIVGDAPIQACVWDEMVTAEFIGAAREMASRAGVPLQFIDFRRAVAPSGDLTDGVAEDVRDLERYALFDLAADSLLEPISDPVGRFRVTNYDPRELTKTHHPGRHQYLLCKEAFEADVVLQLPKLKTHRKAGITGAIKNLVGLNGNKDYLPHHRVGGTAVGGDCYPGKSLNKRAAEWLLDAANRRIGTAAYPSLRRLAMLQAARCYDPADGALEGGWHGNDTCWRMVLDLNRILLYGRADGSMADRRQRVIYSLTEAIVCGQGEGPLAPEPLPAGLVTFASSSPIAERIHAALLGLPPEKIPLVQQSFAQFRWPLVDPDWEPEAYLGGEALTCRELAQRIGVKARPPAGWAGHVEVEAVG